MTKLKVYAKSLEATARGQVDELVNTSAFADAKVCIMPDAHAGMGCVIGFTAHMGDKVVPNLIGVDIGCGMLAAKLKVEKLDLKHLDEIIHRNVPSGFKVHARDTCDVSALDLLCIGEIKNIER